MNKIKVALLIVALGILFSCTAEKAPDEMKKEIQSEEMENAGTEADREAGARELTDEENSENKAPGNDIDRSLTLESLQEAFVAEPAEAHARYLDDPLEFFKLPELPDWKQSAVAASELCTFYPMEVTNDTLDQESLPEGVNIPFGTVLPIFEKIEAADQNYYGMFLFQENYNWFYTTEWEGQKGVVFGADLHGIKDTLEENNITSILYQNNAVFNLFPEFRGYTVLEESVKERLKAERLAFQRVRKDEYRLSLQSPDDMIALYKREAADKYQPVFISTDLYAHGMHLFFNNYLQQIEEDVFFPRLQSLVDRYLEVIGKKEAAALEAGIDNKHNYLEALKGAKNYFLVADALLAQAPEKVIRDRGYGREELEYLPPDREKVIAEYPESIRAETELIEEAASFALSPNFNYQEDYSQYKPRGHYTKNGILQTYFNTMMWFGRIHFYISASEGSPAFELSKKMVPIAIVVSNLAKEDEALYNEWQLLFDPITELIGMSDDLSISDLSIFHERFNIGNLPEWLDNEDNITRYINEAKEELRPPLISGNSLLFAPADKSDENPLGLTQSLGWRLFGQRFTYDSYIHQQLSAPRFFPRDFVSGLDIMTVFGSNTARGLLETSEYLNPDMEGLKDRHETLRAKFEEMSPDIWEQTYYNRVLQQIRSQARFEPGSGFYFTESPAWGIKAMLSSHGTWAALRHDTILYVKQVYAERAGDGDMSPTFRTKPVPQPVHYLEPNRNFFRASSNAILHLQYIMKKYHINDDIFDQRVESWRKLLQKSLAIAETEYADQVLSREDINWIRTIPEQMAKLVVPREANYASYSESPEQFRSAVIADIFTNAEYFQVIETGTGIPYRIYVPLNDGQGGKRIAVGYTFSYYEFRHPMNDRLTDEQWKEQVYAESADLSEYEPSWSKDITLPPLQ